MILILIFTILVILCLIFIVTLFKDEDREGDSSLFFVLSMLVLFSVVIGIELGHRDSVTSKKLLKPAKVKVECVDGNCDTTYVYEFKK